MYDWPAIVYVLNLFWHSQNMIEAFLKLSPAEQAYVQVIGVSLLGALLKPAYRLVKAGLKLLKRFRNR